MLRSALVLTLVACNSGKDISDSSSDTQETADTVETGAPPSPACSGTTASGDGQYACVSIDTREKSSIHERVAGFNMSIKNHGLAIWDNRVLTIARDQLLGHVRFPGVSYVANWRTGQLERDWILRFESDDVCDPDDASACQGDYNHPNETCAPQPTAAHPDTHQCQRVCTPETETQDCDSGEICHFGQCAVACIGEADITTCEALDTSFDENGQPVEHLVQRNRECAKDDNTDRWGCVGGKVANYLGYEEVVSGKGFSSFGDSIRFAESVGAQILIHANSMTDSPESLYDLAVEVLDRDVEVGAWLLSLETFYFRSPNSPPTFWMSGWEYAEDMERYIAEIERAYSERGLEPPLITLSFSDHENDWQSVWDAGKDLTVDPSANDNKPGIGDYIAANGRSFSGTDFHWYPGSGSTPFAEAEILANTDLQNHAIPFIDDYFLPLSCADTNGVCSDPDEPKITVTEFNIQTTWSSAMAAVHASEFMLRLADHERVAILGYHSLVDGCLDTADNHRYSAKYADRYNVYGTFDSNVLDPADGSQAVNFGEVKSLSCLALGLVNHAINTSANAYATEVETDALPDDPDGVLSGDTGLTDPPAEGLKLYAKAFESETEDILILTNRSDVPHHVTPFWNGERLEHAGVLDVLAGEAPNHRNCFEMDQAIGEGELCTSIDLLENLSWDPAEVIEVPAWGVVRLRLPRAEGELAAVSNLAATAGPRSVSVSFDALENATAYDIRYGVTEAAHTRRLQIDAAECTSTCNVSLENLAHDIEHSLSVTALDGETRGASSVPVVFTPSRVELFTGTWGPPEGDSSWVESQGTVQTTAGTQASYLPMADAAAVGRAAIKNGCFEVVFRITDCSCDPAIGTSSYTGNETACERFGLTSRYTDADQLLLAYLEFKPEYGCYFRLSHKANDDGTVVSGVLNRSAYIGVPIEQSPGITRLDAWGEPAYPTIPDVADGNWHRLRLSVDGQVVRVWLDDRLIAAAQDHYLEAGTIGLFTRRQDIEWRNFSVWDAPW
ncbi:MAG: hypothetical protein VXW32_03950 [Myxococcota bacterium]|nr:hypothetical protein [Myxococcota bacterium]